MSRMLRSYTKEPATILIYTSQEEFEGLKKLLKGAAEQSAQKRNRRILENIKNLLEGWDHTLTNKKLVLADTNKAQALLDHIISQKVDPHDEIWNKWAEIREQIVSHTTMYISTLYHAGRNPSTRGLAEEEIRSTLDPFYACILAVLAMDLIGTLNRSGGFNMDTVTSNARTEAGNLANSRKWLLEELEIPGVKINQEIFELTDFGKVRLAQVKTPVKFLYEAKRLAYNHPFVLGCYKQVVENYLAK